MNRLNTPFTKNIFFQYGLQIAKYLFPFITLPYLTRVLGPDIYAIRAYILAAMSLMQVLLDYGFSSYGTMAIAQNASNTYKIRLEMSCIAMLRGVLCVVGAFVLALLMSFIPIMGANPIYVVLAYVGVCLKAMLPDFIFQGLEDMQIITRRFVLSQAIATLLILVLVRGPGDLLLVPLLEGLASFIAFAWSWGNVFHSRGLAFVGVSKKKAWSVFKSSTFFFISNASTTGFTALTTLMIGMLIPSPADISYWSIAMTAIVAIQSLYTPITNSLYPHMVKRQDFGLLKKLLVSGTLAVTVGTIAFAFLSNEVMLVLGGEEYLAGAYVVTLVSPVLWLSYPAMLFGFPVLAAMGKAKQLAASSIISALFHIAGLCILATCGLFTIVNVAILRCCTEGILCLIRSYYTLKLSQDFRTKHG